MLPLTAFAATEPIPAAREKWRHYQSPHFELISLQSDAESRDLLYRLELLHTVFLNANGLSVRNPVPVTIYLFNDRRTFDAYKPANASNRNVAGLYLNRPDRAVIMISPSDQPAEAQRVINHEYVHHLNRITGANPPPWVNEGMAEVFSTIELKFGKLTFGRPVGGHVQLLRYSGMMPLDRLFGTGQATLLGSGSDHAGLFYAQSWALFHYWYFGATKAPRDRIDQFIRVCMGARRPLSAAELRSLFADLTGGTFEETQDQLERYVRSGRYQARSLPLPEVAAKETYQMRRPPGDEVRELLADLLVRTRVDPAAKFVLLEATRGPRGARAWESLGTLSLVEGDDHVALQRWEQAIAAGSRNPAILHQVGIRESRRWFSSFDYYFRLPAEKAEQLRTMLARSIEYAPNQSDAYEMLAWVEAAAPQPDPRAINLVQRKFATLDDQPWTLVALALARMRLGDRQGGLNLLGDAEKLNPSEHTLYAIRTTRAILAGKTLPEPPAVEIRQEVQVGLGR